MLLKVIISDKCYVYNYCADLDLHFKLMNMKNKHQIVIVGGGNGGITVAAQLLRKNKSLDIAIIDPSDSHYYQPAWTMVGGGFYDINDTVRPEASVIPAGVTWIKEAVTSFDPEKNCIILASNTEIALKKLQGKIEHENTNDAIKSIYTFDFLGLKSDSLLEEKDLETAM